MQLDVQVGDGDDRVGVFGLKTPAATIMVL